MITADQETWSSIAQLAAEYDTIAAAAQHSRWEALIRRCDLTERLADEVITSNSFGALTAALHRAEACGHDIDRLLSRLVAGHDLAYVRDVGAVLRLRLGVSTKAKRATCVQVAAPQRFIVGMIPEAIGPVAPDMRNALDQRRDLIQARAAALAEAAVSTCPGWLRRLGNPPPSSSVARRDWLNSVVTVAAYSDRYRITSDLLLGPGGQTGTERAGRRRALAAQHRAVLISDTSEDDVREPTSAQWLLL